MRHEALRVLFALVAMSITACGMYCASPQNPYLDSIFALNCDDATPSTSCYAYVNESTTSAGVQVITFRNVNDSLASDSAGNVGMEWRLDNARYFEGANYSYTVFCGNSSAGSSFIVGSPAPYLAGASYLAWAQDYGVLVCLLPVLLLFGLAVLLFFARVTGVI